jgi:hypothetical protein
MRFRSTMSVEKTVELYALDACVRDEHRDRGHARHDEASGSRVVGFRPRPGERRDPRKHREDSDPDRERARRPRRMLDDAVLENEGRLPPGS